MRPSVTLHMLSSLDDRITPEGWPQVVDANATCEALHRGLQRDAWQVGLVTMAEFAEGSHRPATAHQVYPRETWRAQAASSSPFAICFDAAGR